MFSDKDSRLTHGSRVWVPDTVVISVNRLIPKSMIKIKFKKFPLLLIRFFRRFEMNTEEICYAMTIWASMSVRRF